jgi:UPF0176 protein
MTYEVAALYQFVPLPDFRELKDPLHKLCLDLGVRGTLLLAHEGINGTVAGSHEAIDALMTELRESTLFMGRLDNLELKFSTATEMPFQRMKVRLKKEIVTLGDPQTDPLRRVGTYVTPAEWNRLLDEAGIVLLDTRNDFEVEMGTFEGAVDPRIKRFSEFKDFVKNELDPTQHRKVAMFCTGGIRCEKSTTYLLSQGVEDVFHLRGGILKYLEDVPEAQSMWNGGCFVFDERVALGHGLVEQAGETGQSDE